LAAGSLAPAAAQAYRSRSRHDARELVPGNLLISRSVSGCGVANSDGAYPYVFNNDSADGSFGITS
jgi:hypothetical protein